MQSMKKKLFFAVYLFMSFFLCSEQALVELVDNSGKDQIVAIMQHVKDDVVSGCDQPTQYIDSANLKDLNIDAMVDWFSCKTVMGKAMLAKNLQNPISPQDQTGIVELRHACVMELVNNPEYKAKVEQILTAAAEQEAVVIELMSISFKSRSCPALQSLATLKEQGSPLYYLVKTMSSNPYVSTCMLGYEVSAISTSSVAAIQLGVEAWKKFGTTDGIFLAAFSMANALAACGCYYLGLRPELESAGEMRPRIHALRRLVFFAQSLEELADQHCVALQFKKSFITDPNALSIMKELGYSRYNKPSEYIFNPATVGTFLYKIYENHAALAQIFASIAEMDACNAIANKILASKNSEQPFCVAEKLQADTPQVKSKSFWNVLVPKAITNSVTQDRNMVLTGPNAGGKTTAIRAILQNIVLAQTYGVAVAEKFEYTPFDTVLSYLNISDDLLHGDSLFASEVKRAQELLGKVKTLKSDQKLFFALDELFTGTVAEAGEECAYNFIKKISTYDKALSIYATHFKALKKLGDENPRMMNYKVDAPVKNDAGKLVYPYTLSPGASDVCIALDMAREANLFE